MLKYEECYIGMKVRRTVDSFAGMKIGDIGTITYIDKYGGVKLKEYDEHPGSKDGKHSFGSLEPVSEVNEI